MILYPVWIYLKDQDPALHLHNWVGYKQLVNFSGSDHQDALEQIFAYDDGLDTHYYSSKPNLLIKPYYF